jgi:hypothetical protein
MDLEKASILSNQAQVGNSAKDSIKLLRSSARHDVDSVALVKEQVVQYIKCSLGADGNDLVDRAPSYQGTLIVNDKKSTLRLQVFVR